MSEDKREQGIAPTRETLARLKADPVRRLFELGVLASEHEAAAYEIREAFVLISGPVALRVSNPAAAPGQPNERHFPFEHESERRIRLKRRYLKWMSLMAERRVAAWPVRDVVIDELSCREADKKRRARNGTAKKGLIEGLELYCVARGWAAKPAKGRHVVIHQVD